MLENIVIVAGNISAGVYMWIFIGAGLLLIGTAVAGVFTKKKKK